ncbi:hypothetical protein EXS71_01865 [Candidatus Uhrbacteria bacterium]|nr:hypothetical protein [Candidatus Uhrbacteria bacterium]
MSERRGGGKERRHPPPSHSATRRRSWNRRRLREHWRVVRHRWFKLMHPPTADMRGEEGVGDEQERTDLCGAGHGNLLRVVVIGRSNHTGCIFYCPD